MIRLSSRLSTRGAAQAALFGASYRAFTGERGTVTAGSLSKALGPP